MRPPNEVSLSRTDMNMLIFVIIDRLECIDEAKKDGCYDYDKDCQEEERVLNNMLERFKSAGLTWKKLNDGMYETTLQEGNQLLRVEM